MTCPDAKLDGEVSLSSIKKREALARKSDLFKKTTVWDHEKWMMDPF